MKHPALSPMEAYPHAHHDNYSRTLLGFWIYLLSDFVMFGTFFATYAVLRNNTFGGPTAQEIFDLPWALFQSLLLLTAAFTAGLGSACAHRVNKKAAIIFFGITFLMGIAFLGTQYEEFSRMLALGGSWKRSAFLSSFFSLTATFSAHIIIGSLWTVILLVLVCTQGLTAVSVRRLSCLKMFWQFLNLVWVFIFSLVYLLGGKIT